MASPNDYVVANVSLSNASAVSVQNFGVPVVVSYHTKFSQRLQFFQASSLLASLLTLGFTTWSPTYLEAAEILQQNPCPATVGVGRRTSIPLQTETLTCSDGLPGDGYAITITDSLGVAHAISYTIAPNPGAALASSATTNVSNGSPNVTFSAAQTLAQGGALLFGTGAQPGVFYFLNANVAASTAGVLTGNYTGTSLTTAPTTYTAPLAGTFTTVAGSASVASTASQVGVVKPGDGIMFASQPNIFYQVFAVSAGALTLTQPFTGAGSGTDHCVDLSPTSFAATAVETLIAAIANAATVVGAVSVAANVITIARTDGNLTGYSAWSPNLQLADTTADPGITADLEAIQSFNNQGWYAFAIDSNSAAEVKAAAAYAATTGVGGKFFFGNNSDYLATQVPTTTDVFSVLQAATNAKCLVVYDGQNTLGYSGAAAMGYALGRNPGSYAFGYKALQGVTADSDSSLSESQALALNTMTASSPGSGGKNGNYYRTVAGQNFVWPGVCPNGEFADVAIGADWLQVNVQADVLDAIIGLPKVPFTDFGIGIIRAAIKGRLVIAASPAFGLLDPARIDSAPYGVFVPTAASVPQTQRANRNLPNVSWEAGLAGAILTTTIGGTIVP